MLWCDDRGTFFLPALGAAKCMEMLIWSYIIGFEQIPGPGFEVKKTVSSENCVSDENNPRFPEHSLSNLSF